MCGEILFSLGSSVSLEIGGNFGEMSVVCQGIIFGRRKTAVFFFGE